jgi:hypothetical protein
MYFDDPCSEAIPIPIKAGPNELPPRTLANRSTAQPRVPSPRFSISTTRRSVPTAAEMTEYGVRFVSPTADTTQRMQVTDMSASPQDVGETPGDPAGLDNVMASTSPRDSAGPANWSNVMQQSVRMDRRAVTELSNVAPSGTDQHP